MELSHNNGIGNEWQNVVITLIMSHSALSGDSTKGSKIKQIKAIKAMKAQKRVKIGVAIK